MRDYVAANRPVVIEAAIPEWPAFRVWRKDRPELFIRRPNNQAGLDM